MEMRLRTPVTRGYFFLINVTSPPTISIDKKKISSGTQGNNAEEKFENGGFPMKMHSNVLGPHYTQGI